MSAGDVRSRARNRRRRRVTRDPRRALRSSEPGTVRRARRRRCAALGIGGESSGRDRLRGIHYQGTMSAMSSITTSRLTAQGQTSVPAEVRRLLGLGTGALLEWEVGNGRAIVTRKGGFTFADVHRRLFPDGPPKPLTVEQMDEAIRRRLRAKHARG